MESWNCDADETGCQAPEGPILCAKGCGFFGSKATMNLCSKCYRDIVQAQAQASSAFEKAAAIDKRIAATPTPDGSSASCDPPPLVVAAVPTPAAAAAAAAAEQQLPRPSNRCFSCNKRVGLTGFKCRCGDVFCSMHRYSDKHDCPFDYKAAARDAIAKANPVVKASKIDKI